LRGAQLIFVEEEDVTSPDAVEFFKALGASSPSSVVIADAESAGADESIGGGPFSVPQLYQVKHLLCFLFGAVWIVEFCLDAFMLTKCLL
jgi:hypothetical protein